MRLSIPPLAHACVAALASAAVLVATPAMAEEPQRGGVLTFSIAAEPPTYDCHATGTFATIQRVAPHYSTLLHFAQGDYPKIVGDVADSWTVSPDHLTYTFKLHPGVVFHDGSAFTSEDVKATYDRIRNPPAGVVSARQSSLVKVDSIDTPDPLTVVFHMKEADASILTAFASPWNCLYSAAKLKQDPNYPVHNVMGTGPFKFVEHVAGSSWTGERFDRYFRPGHPYLDGFKAITMGSAATLNALEGKQVMADFRGFSPAERDRIVRGLGADAHVQERTWLLHMDVSFNIQRKPFDDARVRRALSLAIDRWGGSKSLGRISVLRDVGGVVLPGAEYAASDAELEKLPGFGRDMAANRAEAKRLLHEAGADNLTVTLMDRNIAPYVTAGVYVIDQWRQIGVKVVHQEQELSGYYSALYGSNFDAIVDSYTDYNDDPTTQLVKFLSADTTSLSSSHFQDADLDRLFAAQARSTDPVERKSLVRQFEARAMEQSYSVPILWWYRIVVMNKIVEGWTMSPSHMIYQDLGDVWLKKP
jgi:peptide/nickel transport system substrate-binding protein